MISHGFRIYKRKDRNIFFDKLTNSHPILKALNSGKLIIFVGAGMSVHLGLPSWREFAIKYLEIIYKNSQTTSMNFKTKEGLKTEDTKKYYLYVSISGRKTFLIISLKDIINHGLRQIKAMF